MNQSDIISLNLIEHYLKFLDFKTIHYLMLTSKGFYNKIKHNKYDELLDLRNQKFNNLQIKAIQRKSLSKFTSVIYEFQDIEEEDLTELNDHLKVLNINGCHKIFDQSLTKLKGKLSELEKIELYWMPQLKDEGIKFIILNSPNLKYLNLSGCKNLTDESVSLVSDYCKNIISLNLTRCSGLTEKSFQKVCSLPHLEYFNLYALANLKCVFFKELALNQTCNIKFLDLCGNQFLIDDCIKMCLKQLKNLSYFNLSWCINLTDDGLIEFMKQSTSLELLSIHGILGFTDNLINTMIANKNVKRNLKTFDFYGCVNIKKRDKEYMKSVFPYLKEFKHHS